MRALQAAAVTPKASAGRDPGAGGGRATDPFRGDGAPLPMRWRRGSIRYLMTRNRRSREDAQWLFNELPTPDTLPAFRSLQVDEAGWIWAEVFHWDMTRQSGDWMIFDPEGRAQGILSAPEDLQIQRIGEDFLLGVWWDDWGIEHVRKYSLTREPTETDPKAGGVRAPPPAFLPWDTPWPQ